MVSILNHESQGFFFAQFDGGHRGRFSFLLDYQARIPVANFGINAGERGLIYAFDQGIDGPDIWMAFYARADYQRGRARYSDDDDLILANKYTMKVDVTEPKKWLRLTTRLECVSRSDGVIAVPFVVGEDLSHIDDDRGVARLEKAFVLVTGAEDIAKRVRAAHIRDWHEAVKKGVITQAEGDQLAAAHQAVAKVIEVDDFAPDALAPIHNKPAEVHQFFQQLGETRAAS